MKKLVLYRQFFGCGGIVRRIDTQGKHFVKCRFYEMLYAKYTNFEGFLL